MPSDLATDEPALSIILQPDFIRMIFSTTIALNFAAS